MTNAEAITRAARHQEASELAQAEALYRQVLVADAHDANATYRLAVVCQMQGRAAEAIPLYQQLLQLKPESAKIHNNLGLAYSSLGRHDEAAACYQEAIRQKPDFAEAFNNLGNLFAAQNEWDRAIDAYCRALGLKPQFPAASINLGRAYLEQHRWQEAVGYFQAALAVQPTDAAVWNNLGNAWLNQGKLSDAEDCYRQALRARTNDAEAHYNLARVFAAQSQWQHAAAALQSSLASNADSVKAHRFLGDIFYCQLGQYSEALRCYQRVLELSPADVKARLLAGALSGRTELTRVPLGYVTATYDPLAARFDQYVGQRGDRSPHWLKAVLEPAPQTPSLAVLDLGCGTGLCGLQFRPWAETLIGVDLSANMLAKARQRGIYDQLIEQDVAAALQSYEANFDLVLASDVLLYMGDLAPVFAAVQRALRPGGRFAFSVDVFSGPADYHLTPWVHFAHSRAYLQRVATDARLREVRVQAVVFPRDGGHAAAGLVAVLASISDAS